jgi:CDGSH-type Zn-finger protein
MAEPVMAQKSPYAVDVEAGRKYFWCACGLSRKQPFCDGSHKGTGLSPISYEAAATETKYFCGCKQTHKQPFCDGTHNAL